MAPFGGLSTFGGSLVSAQQQLEFGVHSDLHYDNEHTSSYKKLFTANRIDRRRSNTQHEQPGL